MLEIVDNLNKISIVNKRKGLVQIDVQHVFTIICASISLHTRYIVLPDFSSSN